jgi:transposase
MEVKEMFPENEAFDLESRFIGALPVVNHFLVRLQIESLLEERLLPPDPRNKVAPVRVLMVLLRSLILSKAPLYSVSEWATSMLPEALGLTSVEAAALNDDRLGRALDDLFISDRVALLTDFVLRMIPEFQIRLDELHNDSTTLTFQGDYRSANGGEVNGIPTHRITYGHNKDFRPDLKQLLWILTVSSDGAVPVHFKVDHGNIGDPTTHIETWNLLRRIVGGPKFLYVADCKLCTSDNLRFIDEQHGSFITVLPRNRKENDCFREWIAGHDADWQTITSIEYPGPRDLNVIQALESPVREVNGFRLIWFRSSEKTRRDAEIRHDATVRADKALDKFAKKLLGRRCGFKMIRTVRKAIDEILDQAGAKRWMDYSVEHIYLITDQQEEKAKRPGAPSRIRQTKKLRFRLSWHVKEDVVHADSRSDGVLPLVTNRSDLSPLQVYVIYHCNQPLIEKRHDLLKNTLQVTPAFLHNISRLEALLFLEYLAVTVHALVERELRIKMCENHRPQIPLYPEARSCSAPTAERVFEIFEHLQTNTLMKKGRKVQTFQPRLTELQKEVLELLVISPLSYSDY